MEPTMQELQQDWPFCSLLQVGVRKLLLSLLVRMLQWRLGRRMKMRAWWKHLYFAVLWQYKQKTLTILMHPQAPLARKAPLQTKTIARSKPAPTKSSPVQFPVCRNPEFSLPGHTAYPFPPSQPSELAEMQQGLARSTVRAPCHME